MTTVQVATQAGPRALLGGPEASPTTPQNASQALGATRNTCSDSSGISVRIRPESLFGFARNHCSFSAGLHSCVPDSGKLPRRTAPPGNRRRARPPPAECAGRTRCASRSGSVRLRMCRLLLLADSGARHWVFDRHCLRLLARLCWRCAARSIGLLTRSSGKADLLRPESSCACRRSTFVRNVGFPFGLVEEASTADRVAMPGGAAAPSPAFPQPRLDWKDGPVRTQGRGAR